MSQLSPPPTSAPDDDSREQRRAAARMLRAARAAARDAAHDDDAIDWAFATLPDSVAVQRLRIEHLLAQGHDDDAQALIAQALLQRPTHLGLTLLRARTLLRQGILHRAQREIDLVVERRPHHVATRLTAARIAAARLDHDTALEHLEVAARRCPDRDDIGAMIVEQLLAAGRVEASVRRLEPMPNAAPLLRARVLAASDRPRDALVLLSGVELPHDPAIVCERLALLERLGDRAALASALADLDEPDPATLLAAGRAWLHLGMFRTAVRRLAALRHHRAHGRHALAIVAVAAAMLGRVRLAHRALDRRGAAPNDASGHAMTDLWRRALTARSLARQATAAPAGPRPAGLAALYEHAGQTLEAARGRAGRGPAGDDRREAVTLQRDLCRAASRRLAPDASPNPAGPVPTG